MHHDLNQNTCIYFLMLFKYCVKILKYCKH